MYTKEKIMDSIQPIKGHPDHKSYFCPYCNELLLRGKVRRLAMACPNCNTLIRADAEKLIES